jgi:hypothetical protein
MAQWKAANENRHLYANSLVSLAIHAINRQISVIGRLPQAQQ